MTAEGQFQCRWASGSNLFPISLLDRSLTVLISLLNDRSIINYPLIQYIWHHFDKYECMGRQQLRRSWHEAKSNGIAIPRQIVAPKEIGVTMLSVLSAVYCFAVYIAHFFDLLRPS